MTPIEVLRQYFGHDRFRPGQLEVIESILAGRDALTVMPTGAGKSACYQIPAMIMPGAAIVVSPLISLMRDQVRMLAAAGFPAAAVNSSLPDRELSRTIAEAMEGRFKVVYVAPERLMRASMLKLAVKLKPSLVAVDEAHCISAWGQDFRPTYLDVPKFVRHLENRPILAAFTATASRRVQEDVVSALGLESPLRLVTSFDRPNLFFSAVEAKDKYAALVRRLDGLRGGAIVYCATHKLVEEVAGRLAADGFSAARYHAGLSADERSRNQDDFLFDRVGIMVATVAFGMGIDKSNVRLVVHHNMPMSVENYYQEAGRAGRDGLPADCVLLHSKGDVRLNQYIINLGGNMEENSRRRILLDQMKAYCRTKGCLRRHILNYFGEPAPEGGNKNCGACGNCLPAAGTDDDAASPAPAAKKRHAGERGKKAGQAGEAPRYEYSEETFERLEELRRTLAEESRIPPTFVFSDATLVDMCLRHPRSPEEMLAVSGVGEAKLKLYGRPFLDLLNELEPGKAYSGEKSGLTPETLKELVKVEDSPIQISLVADNINAVLARHNKKKTSPVSLNKLMLAGGHLSDETGEKLPSETGAALGVTTVVRNKESGPYIQCLFGPEAQRACLDMLIETMDWDK